MMNKERFYWTLSVLILAGCVVGLGFVAGFYRAKSTLIEMDREAIRLRLQDHLRNEDLEEAECMELRSQPAVR